MAKPPNKREEEPLSKNTLKTLKQSLMRGRKAKEPMAFKYYDAERLVMGKPMKEHLPFAMAWVA